MPEEFEYILTAYLIGGQTVAVPLIAQEELNDTEIQETCNSAMRGRLSVGYNQRGFAINSEALSMVTLHRKVD